MNDTQKQNLRTLIDALKSGEYTHGKMRLKTNDNSFCCLGVWCDVKDSSKWNLSDSEYIGFTYLSGHDNQYLPYELISDFDLDKSIRFPENFNVVILKVGNQEESFCPRTITDVNDFHRFTATHFKPVIYVLEALLDYFNNGEQDTTITIPEELFT